MDFNVIVILGPTASGKTRLAARLAKELSGEIISADSRQVYRGLDIGTGKDVDEYLVEGERIPCHLIDIVNPQEEFSVFDYRERFYPCFSAITARKRWPILVGGTGLYLDAVLKGYRMLKVPENPTLRADLHGESIETLIRRLQELKPSLHNKTDLEDRRRLVRAIEIAAYTEERGPLEEPAWPRLVPLIFGLKWERSVLRRRITKRLEERLTAGMIGEVKDLHDRGGCTWEKMDFFGLEYRYIGLYLQGKLDYQEMFRQLNTKIHQFAKRQETWFRRMERQGMIIHWLGNPDFPLLRRQVEHLIS